MGLEQVVAQMPAAVLVVDARSHRIVHANVRPRDVTERPPERPIPPELTPDWEIFDRDGQAHAMHEWPLVRSITPGEDVVDGDVLSDRRRVIVRCSSSAITPMNDMLSPV
jgi:PAS domain-containing protein